MNRLILLSIFLVFISIATSTPLKRQDLSGFKQCEGNIPNTLTTLTYSPNPTVTGQNVYVHLGGMANEIVEQGAKFKAIVYEKNTNKVAFTHVLDYCSKFVEPSGSKCPVGKGDFNFTATWFIEQDPNDPKHVVIEYDANLSGTFTFFFLKYFDFSH